MRSEILQDAIGWRFFMKISILVIILMASIIIYRPFCKYLCPLGAIYGLFNKVSFIRYNINTDKCTDCRACVKVCKMDVNVRKNPNEIIELIGKKGGRRKEEGPLTPNL